jgi:hypothetical protein
MNMSILDSLIAQNKEKARAVSEAQEETSKIGIDLKRSAVGDDGVSNEVFTAATTRFNLGKEYYNEYMNIIDTAMEDSNRGAVQRYEKAM